MGWPTTSVIARLGRLWPAVGPWPPGPGQPAKNQAADAEIVPPFAGDSNGASARLREGRLPNDIESLILLCLAS
jgi:hypothetical protein